MKTKSLELFAFVPALLMLTLVASIGGQDKDADNRQTKAAQDLPARAEAQSVDLTHLTASCREGDGQACLHAARSAYSHARSSTKPEAAKAWNDLYLEWSLRACKGGLIESCLAVRQHFKETADVAPLLRELCGQRHQEACALLKDVAIQESELAGARRAPASIGN